MIDGHPRISVVMPVFNKAAYISRAIESVLTQHFHEFELIVVDDGSTDQSANVIRTFADSRVRFLQQPNSGVSAARNTGIRHANGQLIAFLDADDAWEPSFLEEIDQKAREAPNSQVYGTAFQVRERDGTLQRYHATEIATLSDKNGYLDYYECVSRGIYPLLPSSTCVKRSAFELCGLFDTTLQIGEDIDMFLRILAQGTAIYSPRLGATYHRDATNRSIDQDRLVDKYDLLLRKMILNLRNIPPSAGKHAPLSRYVANLMDLTLTSMVHSGRAADAWKISLSIIKDTSLRMGLRGASRTLLASLKRALLRA